MLEQLIDIKAHLDTAKDRYKKIYLIVNLTEDLRESKYTRRINIDSLYQTFWKESQSITDFLVRVEKHLFSKLETYQLTVPYVEMHFARVFTDVWPENTSPLLLDKSWCDVIQDRIQFRNYQQPVPFIGQMSIDPLTEKFISTQPERKLEFLEIMERVGTRWNFLGASEYNLKGSTCHPNPAGHQLWADYLYTQIDK
jgi:hypothetical protein